MVIKIEVVTEKDWPIVKTLMVDSLHDLEFYKSIASDSTERKSFVTELIEYEYKRGNDLFWYGKLIEEGTLESDTEKNCCNIAGAETSKIFMAGALIPPVGFVFDETVKRSERCCPKCNAERLLSPINSTGANVVFSETQSNILLLKYPEILHKLKSFHTWYSGYTQKISDETKKKFWQCSHIAVGPEYRKTGMAAGGMREAIKMFLALSDANNCHLVLINTGVKECRYACLQADFYDVVTLSYECKPRWLMLNDIKAHGIVDEHLLEDIRRSISTK